MFRPGLLITVLAFAGASCRPTAAAPQEHLDAVRSTPPPAVSPSQPAVRNSVLPVRTTRFAPAGAGKNVHGALARPFKPAWSIQTGKPKKSRRLRNCNEYLALATDDIETDDPEDQWPLIQQLADCQALQMLSQAGPSARTFLGGFRLNAKAPAALPADFYLDLSPDEEAEVKAAVGAGRTWKSFDPKVHVTPAQDSRVQLQLKGHGYSAGLAEVARGDFDHDGIEDILIRRIAFPDGGSLTDYSVFVLTRTSETAPLRTLKTWRQAY
jgi:hypothetical protein